MAVKVLYDYQAFMIRYSGVSRYFCEVIDRLKENNDLDIKVSCPLNFNKYLEECLGKKAIKSVHWRLTNELSKINKCLVKNEISKDYNIVHATYLDPYVFDYRKDAKIVCTVHDMTREIFCDTYYKNDKFIGWQKKYIYNSDHIFAVSHNTKKDILKFYPDIPEDRISVVHHGCSELIHDKDNKKYDLPERYVLFVGARFAYKNFERFVKASKIILEKDNDIKVIFAGGGEFNKSERQIVCDHDDKIIQMPADDKMLSALYENALCLVYPSLYEGFGMPVLEAFSAGCPVVSSNTSSLPEVGGEAAAYFDPYSIEEMAEVIKDVIYNDDKRKQMADMGRKRKELFSWDRSAEKMAEQYKLISS